MSRFTWCEKSSALAVALHLANVECEKTEQNSKAALEAIGMKIAKEFNHTGVPINAHSVRSKLSSSKNADGSKVYQPLQVAPKSKKGFTVSKASMIEKFAKDHGLTNIDTLANANAKEIETLIQHADNLRSMLDQATQELKSLTETYE